MLPECLTAARAAGVAAAVFDNASPDRTADLVARDFPWVRLVCSSDNQGFGRATNSLAASSSAEYLMPLNPDAILRPDVPGKLREALDTDAAAIAAGPQLIFPHGERQTSNQRFPDLKFEIAEAVTGTRFVRFGRWDLLAEIDRVLGVSWRSHGRTERTDVLWATCWLMRASDYGAHGLFDERLPMYDEDYDYCARMGALGRMFLYVPSATVVHYGGTASSGEETLRLRKKARFRYYRLRRGLGYALAYRAITGTITGCIGILRSARDALKDGGDG